MDMHAFHGSLITFVPAITGWLLSTVLLLLVILHLFLLYKAATVFCRIPERHYEPWFMPQDLEKTQLPFMKPMPVRLKLRCRYFDKSERQFTVSLPPRIKMGKLFCHFVLEQRKTDPAAIECEDEQHCPYAWEFYASEFGGMTKRALDPDKDLMENNLQENSTIFAKRIGRQSLVTDPVS